MYPIFLKEIRQFFGSLSGYLSIGLFLLLMGLFLFIFPDTSLFEYGYATLDKFFELAPWVLMLLAPAVTMRSFSDEFRTGTWELLKTRPLRMRHIIGGKYLAAWVVVLLALLPTVVYVITIRSLSINGTIDSGGIAGAYIGLILLSALFTAIGICCSSLTANPVISFLLAAFSCFLLFTGFQSVSQIAAFSGGADWWIQSLGIEAHYRSISRGLAELPDLVYFFVLIAVFLTLTRQTLSRR